MVSALAFGWADNTFPQPWLFWISQKRYPIIVYNLHLSKPVAEKVSFNAAHFCHRYRMQIHVFYGSWFYKESQENLHLPTVDKRDGVKASFGLE